MFTLPIYGTTNVNPHGTVIPTSNVTTLDSIYNSIIIGGQENVFFRTKAGNTTANRHDLGFFASFSNKAYPFYLYPGTNYYNTNKTMLKEVFGTANCTESSSQISCTNSVWGIRAVAMSSGQIIVEDTVEKCNFSGNIGGYFGCTVTSSGSSTCICN